MVVDLTTHRRRLQLLSSPPAPDPSPEPVYPVKIVWIGSPNYYEGRLGRTIFALCVHTMQGTLAGSDSWFQQTADERKRVSAHYGVPYAAGDAHQYVRDEDTAWANGVIESGSKWLARFGYSNPNSNIISIETDDRGDPANFPVTDDQYEITREIGRLKVARFPTIFLLTGHHTISPLSRSGCPGRRWTDHRMAQLAQDLKLELFI